MEYDVYIKNEIKIKKSGSELDNSYTLSANLTSGQIIAIKNALQISGTPVSLDVLNMFNKAILNCKGIE